MNVQPQTAIRGVFSVGIVNVLARLAAYGKHLVIAAYIGLSAGLDAFYIAITILSISIFVFGDIFDSLGIPRLVKTLQVEGEDGYKDLAGSILAFSLILSLGLCAVLLLVAPWTPQIAPGFTPEKKGFVLSNLLFLAPMAFLYLPYHAMGSFLRARRRFHLFYIGELLIALVSLLVILCWPEVAFIIPISFSAGYAVAFLYVSLVSRNEFRLIPGLHGEKIRGILRMLLHLLPLYLANYLFILVDRVFASYLSTGGVSALSYGVMIMMIPASILMLENVFITPLSESAEKGELVRRILTGTLILSVPIAVFVAAYAVPIVKAAFERGMFTPGSTKMTGEALEFYALAIPVIFAGPVLVRLFQILERLGKITIVSFCVVALNGGLNLLFMKLGMGIRGIALASTISWYAGLAGHLYFLRQFGISAVGKDVARVLMILIGISAAALGVTSILPIDADSIGGLAVCGAVFLLMVGMLVILVPNEEIRHWRGTVSREILFREKRTDR